MNRAILLDVDGTLTESLVGATFKQNSRDVKVMDGVKEALKYYENQVPKWVMVGISNQGGCSAINPETGKPRKSIEDAIAEFQYTLELLPQLKAVYFCPDFEGKVCYKVYPGGKEEKLEASRHSYRKPGAGMVLAAAKDYNISIADSWFIGDRKEDEECATAAGVNFMEAEMWHNRFRPGMYVVKPATIEQVRFLESSRFLNENN